MQLLDLPPELFQHIIHDLVSVAGVSGAWKYRQLCRTFAAEISYDIFAKSDLDIFTTSTSRRILERGLDIYLLNRLEFRRRVNPRFLAKLTAMIDWLMQERKMDGKVAQKNCTQELCKGLRVLVKPEYIIGALESSHDEGTATTLGSTICCNWHGNDLTAYDNMLAAVACGQYLIVKNILPDYATATQASRKTQDALDPLAMAVGCMKFEYSRNIHKVLKDERLLECILEYLESLNLKANRNKESYKALVARPSSVFAVWSAIEHTIRISQHGTLKTLLDFCAHQLPRPHQSEFYDQFHWASLHRNEDALQLLIDFAPNGRSMVNRKCFQVALPHSDWIVKNTLARLEIADMNVGTASVIPLFMAVRSGEIIPVRLMLQAGSDVNTSVPNIFRALDKDHVTPLDIALYFKHTGMAIYLLNHGAEVPHVSQWPTNKESFNLLRDWEIEHTGANIPTWAEGRRLRNNGLLEELEY